MDLGKTWTEINDSRYKLYLDGIFDCIMTITDSSDIGKAIDAINVDFPDAEVRLEKISAEEYKKIWLAD